MPLSPKPGILDIVPYVPGKSKSAATRTIKLSSNESALGASPKAIAAYEAAEKLLHRYPEGTASELRQAIGEVYGLNPERIVCGAGSDELIALLIQAYAGFEDEVLYSQYGFLMYPISALKVGAKPVKAPEINLQTDIESLLRHVTTDTKIVFIANPNNPTGSYISKEALVSFRQRLPEHILLVIDAAYAEYVENADYTAGQDIVDLGENTVMLRTFSKIYGLGSLRIGWAYCPVSIADILNRVRGPFNVSTAAIKAGAAAVRDTEFTQKCREHNTKWLQYLTQEITAIGYKVYPSVANFILVEFPDTHDGNANAVNHFLQQQGVIVRGMAAYDLANCLRITVGTEEENTLLVQLLRQFHDSLK